MQQLGRVIGALMVVFSAACQQHVSTAPAPERTSTALPHAALASPTSASLQMILVITDDWNAVPGVMRRFERDGVRSPWRAVGADVAVVVGASGLGWGDGLHGIGSPGEPGPIKHEGDNRSPAGVFGLTTTFGYEPKEWASWISMPYTQATDAYKCVDDPASIHYNEMILRAPGSPVDWHSAEDMHRPDSLYRLGVVVAHNANGREVGHGSCIFLHIWPGPGGNTSGCTAFGSDAMMQVLAWLKPDALPILVQLTRSEYDRLGTSWALPRFTPSPAGLDSVVLERTPCYGTCPAYRLSVHRDGTLRFQSRNRGDDTAVVQDRMNPKTLDLIASLAASIGFDKYPATIAADRRLCSDSATDHPTIDIGLFGATSKQVEYYTGCYLRVDHTRDESLARLAELAAQIDSLTRSSRWVRPGGKR